jgi:Chaperone of endosialidase
MKKTLFTLVCSLLAVGTFGQSVLITPNASGNVGIKNNNPQNILQIGPATSPSFLGNDMAIGNSAGGGMSFFQSGAATTGNSIWYSNSNFALLPAYGGTGNVGINLINPTSRLEVFQTGKTQAGFGSYVSPMRLGIGVTGSHAVVGDNYDAVGIAGFGANANSTKRNIGLFGTSGVSGGQNIGVMAYQNGNFDGSVYGSFNNIIQSGTAPSYASYNSISNSSFGTSSGVFSEIYNTSATGSPSIFGITSVVSSNPSNINTDNYGIYANVDGAGSNYGVYTSVSGSSNSYAVAAFGNSFFDGNVAVGASFPTINAQAKLVVTGFKGVSTGTSSYFNPGNAALYTQVTSGANLSVYATHGIVSGLYIGAALSVTASDNRIKNIKGISNSAADLARLRKIEITDYTMKDAATWGKQTFKKVIAQQVESVYPEVIKLQTSVIPDIYALAESVVYDAATKNLRVTLSKEYNIKIGEKIELVHPEKDKILAEVIAINGKTFTVKDWAHATDKIFVFGRQVNDFRSVDYEALSMLGISSIQQLAKENEELRITIDELRLKNKTLDSKNEKTEARLEAIENLLKSNVPSGK